MTLQSRAYWPYPPDGASDNVIEAYTKWPYGLTKRRILTPGELRMLNRGLRRGELRNIEDPNRYGSKASRMCWGPVVTFTGEDTP